MAMKLNKYQDKSMSKRKLLLISLSVIVLISVSLILYKTFASFNEHVEFPIMNGKVDYFGNSDVYFAFYNGNEKLESMPLKDNSDGLLFSHGECDNGATIEWNSSEWAPLIRNLSKSKTKCSLYFGKPIELGKDILPIESGDGLYTVTHDVSEISTDWNKTEYRYAGANPNNYVSFNNELWRIIGLVNVKTDSGVEQRIKIIRVDGIEGQKDFGKYSWEPTNSSNNWNVSKLKDMLNGIYYKSQIGECYTGDGKPTIASQCDFTGNGTLPNGLNDVSRNMIDKDVIWSLGGSATHQDVTVKQFYERERSTNTYGDKASEWSNTTDVDGMHNGIGLMYPSDFGYATNGGNIGRKICFDKELYNWDKTVDNYNYQSECGGTDWLKPNNMNWTITPNIAYNNIPFDVYQYGTVAGWEGANNSLMVWPVVYLKSNVKITGGTGEESNPFIVTLS